MCRSNGKRLTRKRSPEPYVNSIAAPTYQSASYYFDNADQVKSGLHELTVPAGRYGRYGIPTCMEVEAGLSELRRAESSLLFASGMAAHFTPFVSLLKADDEVV